MGRKRAALLVRRGTRASMIPVAGSGVEGISGSDWAYFPPDIPCVMASKHPSSAQASDGIKTDPKELLKDDRKRPRKSEVWLPWNDTKGFQRSEPNICSKKSLFFGCEEGGGRSQSCLIQRLIIIVLAVFRIGWRFLHPLRILAKEPAQWPTPTALPPLLCTTRT